MGEAAAEANLSQFANWYSTKHALRSYPVGNRPKISGKGDRPTRSADSTIANCILGRLGSFRTVFVVKLAVTRLSQPQRGVLKS
ncbi:hypothetical protein IQ269_17795 [Tychonema sp. LEGE 07199]|uniref:hypothetical protein n=1 Tax=unclassified Tychonema TaxID=2642144 RepID=UPI00187E129D|nr:MULTISPECIES: hypothetical protein [unclassified Tychonema]MBE9122602.1 hypothetical protein [Tychonema sp. LEGE 07199]MBE9131478.1 hypothetical protein [Tychonema sp. LEGE 07196]